MKRRVAWAIGLLAVALAVGGWIFWSLRGRSVNPLLGDPKLQAALGAARQPPMEEEKDHMTPVTLRAHVEILAGEIGERNLDRPRKLAAAADWLEEQLRNLYPEHHRRETYLVDGLEVSNLLFERPGSEPELPWLLVGAHYDSAPGTPGADDNASAAAGLLELARHFADRPVRHPMRFVFFTLEEPPYYRTPQMGSMVHAKKAKERGEKITLMVCLEMIGYFKDQPIQQFPVPGMGFLYPKNGDFIGVVSSDQSQRPTHEFHALFRSSCDVDVQVLIAPPAVTGVDFSDHWSFWQKGYAALMITDTAFFRNPHYHRASDLPDTLDYERMSQVVRGLATALAAFDLQADAK